MGLPFTHDQFFDVFSDYNQSLWPFLVLLWILTVTSLIALIRNHPSAQALIRASLIIHWMWSAIAYHAVFFSRINPAAWLFSLLFLVQAGLLWRHASRMLFVHPPRWSVRYAFASMLVLYALIYPGLVWLDGHVFPRAPAFGVPCPTTILTIGLLIGAARPITLATAVIPIIWAFIGGSAAILLGVSADAMLLAAGAGLIITIAAARRFSDRASAGSTRIVEKLQSS